MCDIGKTIAIIHEPAPETAGEFLKKILVAKPAKVIEIPEPDESQMVPVPARRQSTHPMPNVLHQED